MPETPPRKSSRKLKRKLDPEQAESSESHGVTPYQAPLVDETVLPRFSAGANQHFNDVVDLSALPPDLQQRITSKAPFVHGLKDATYDKDWYNQVAGLSASGPHPTDVTEEMMPRSKWARNWGDAAHDPSSRIWLKDAANETIRERYESLYVRVYGNKPDNGGLANFFLRAATYYLEENKAVDWAAQALELHHKRFSNPYLNPQKLIPPCLTKQVQGLVDEVAATIASLHLHAPAEMKNLGPDYLDEPKLRLSLAEQDEAAAINELFRLKDMVDEKGHALFLASKALARHSSDLELLFESKKDAERSGDIAYVKFASNQINAVAKTITDASEVKCNLEHQLEVIKAKLVAAETEFPWSHSAVKTAKCKLLDAISEVGLFPQHVLRRLPTIGPMEHVCPYCARLYVVDAFVPLSCGCRYHPPCMRALILSGHTNCLGCGAPPHGTWMAYWGFPLDERMSTELEEHRTTSMTNDDWVEAPDVVGSSRPFEGEPKTDLTMVPYSPPIRKSRSYSYTISSPSPSL